ncbi:hypothetical protein ABIF29_002435 [Bradyrhizobium elkanii]|uniref:Uncharacterized protein n=1 Tax=Bradyrhizobium elkanii TaxID=29448 RepID=A0ABV4EX59_BRAEL|nr:hypothetical protein [Bradyrhizobium elkanii]MCP1982171.1 hypothetical protein [Bradyrhizobium elkanii]MCS3883045.1 hypothetical protein [Bradyrhizobium elkanii]MCS4217898.1 hypothetical protein [Bradyrhizobium elkanii]MCW2195652.1 hypothetical protein [Bradyrhizobium elkanii]
MLRIARRNPTSPRRGEVIRNLGEPIQPKLIPVYTAGNMISARRPPIGALFRVRLPP